MELRDFGPDDQSILEKMLGYLNFSSGASDPQFLSNLNTLFDRVESMGEATEGPDNASWNIVASLLKQKVIQPELASQIQLFPRLLIMGPDPYLGPFNLGTSK